MMNIPCFSYLWCLSTLLVLSSFCVATTEAHGLLRKFVSSASATATTTTRSLAEEQQQEEELFADDNVPATHNTGETKTITIPILYNLQFFEGSGSYAIPEEGPSLEEIQGLLKATEKFYTNQMEMDPVFENDFVSFELVEDNHRLVLAGTVDPGPPSSENNNNDQQVSSTADATAETTTDTTTLKLEVYAKVELVSASELTQEQTAMAMPAYDLTHLITRYVWRADPQDDPDNNAEAGETEKQVGEGQNTAQNKFKNLFHQTHWLEIIATYMG